MLGPGLDVRGGVASVERLILSSLPAEVQSTHIATMVDGSKATKLWTFLKALATLERSLRRGVDIVHIHFASDASSVRKEIVAKRALMAGKKVVMHAHGGEYQRYWREMTDRQRRRTLAVLTRVAALIVLGEAWREFFIRVGVPAERIVAIPNPVRLPDTIPDRRGKLRVGFVFLGMLSRNKGAFDLLDAIRALPMETLARCHFVMAGNGRGTELRGLVAKYKLGDSVEVRNWVQPHERDRLLSDADVFVLPSLNEGLPMAMLEAMAWGLPVICTPVGSIPEIVRDGFNGLLIQPGEVSQLGHAIVQLVADEPERISMGRAARQSVEKLRPESYVDKLVGTYHAVLKQSTEKVVERN
jgi:glycosyltransferase involved in cell wall biosynthesis